MSRIEGGRPAVQPRGGDQKNDGPRANLREARELLESATAKLAGGDHKGAQKELNRALKLIDKARNKLDEIKDPAKRRDIQKDITSLGNKVGDQLTKAIYASYGYGSNTNTTDSFDSGTGGGYV